MKKLKSFISDFFFSAVGLVSLTGVISFIVYPVIQRRLGTQMQGEILFFIAVSNLIAGAVGSGANYGRMKIYAEYRRSENGDSDFFLLFSALVSLLAAILAVFMKGDSAGAGLLCIAALIFANVLRNYGDVEYRLRMNYKKYSLYYLTAAAGYLAGLGLFFVTGQWLLIFLTGELAATFFVLCTGSIYRGKLFERSDLFKKNFSADLKISLSFFLSDFVGASDRLLFPLILVNGDELTSLYYYASIVGKMMSLISTPLNGVLNGYISREEGGLKPRTFVKLLFMMAGVFAVVTAAAVGISCIFVCIFYPDYYGEVKSLFLLANAGQVLFYICNVLMVVVLRYTDEKYQMIINVIYILLFFSVTVPLIMKCGLVGMAWGILAVNTAKFLLYAGIGLRGLKRAGAGKISDRLIKEN